MGTHPPFNRRSQREAVDVSTVRLCSASPRFPGTALALGHLPITYSDTWGTPWDGGPREPPVYKQLLRGQGEEPPPAGIRLPLQWFQSMEDEVVPDGEVGLRMCGELDHNAQGQFSVCSKAAY